MTNYEVTYLLLPCGEAMWIAMYIYLRNKAPIFKMLGMRIALLTGCPFCIGVISLLGPVPPNVLMNWSLIAAISFLIWFYVIFIKFPVKTDD